jgi:hypothetical protein
MAFDSHIVTVRRLKKYIDDVIGKKANLPNNKNTIVGNIGELNEKVSNLEPVVDSALIYRGKIKNNNVVYGAFDSGIYTISGSEDGPPLQGYGGFMTTYRESATSILIKHLILQNAYQFVMAQKVDDGTVTLSWVRTYPAG